MTKEEKKKKKSKDKEPERELVVEEEKSEKKKAKKQKKDQQFQAADETVLIDEEEKPKKEKKAKKNKRDAAEAETNEESEPKAKKAKKEKKEKTGDSMPAFEEMMEECRDCHQLFPFTVGEQEFYFQKGFKTRATRCLLCRHASKERQLAAAGDGKGGKIDHKVKSHAGTSCFLCGEMGHLTYSCPNKKGEKSTAGLCYDFLEGKCLRGSTCRFTHPPPSATNAEDGAGEEGGGGGGGEEGGEAAGGGKKKRGKRAGPCYAFDSEEGCAKGDACIFKHGKNDPRFAKVEPEKKVLALGGEIRACYHCGEGGHTTKACPLKHSGKGTSGGGLCYQFRQGHCNFGDNCRFEHYV